MKTLQRTPRFDRHWDEVIAIYPNESDRLLLTSAIKQYQLDGTEPQLPPELMVAFEFLRPTIDRRARNRARRKARTAAAQPAIQPAIQPAVDLPVAPTSTPESQSTSLIPTTAVGATGRSTACTGSDPTIKTTVPDNNDRFLAPDETDMAQRFKFWENFTKSRSSNLTQKDIENDRLDFETDLWENEENDTVPDNPDGSPMLYAEIVKHYCRILRNDKRLLMRISDEVTRLTGVLFRTDDLREFIDPFCSRSIKIPIINLNRANCRRAFIRYMINYATHYRRALKD